MADRHRVIGVAAVGLVGLVGLAVLVASGVDGERLPAPVLPRLAPVSSISLTTGRDCTELLAYYRSNSAKVVGPYGLPGGGRLNGGALRDTAAAATELAGSGQAAPPDSQTTVQVAGVDEADVVKTRGDLMVSVVDGALRVVRMDGERTRPLATWRPATGSLYNLLLEGDRAVLIGDGSTAADPAATDLAVHDSAGRLMPVGGTAVTRLTLMDLSDPADPRPLRRIDVDGYRSGEARLVDGELRIAVTAGPHGLRWQLPQVDGDWSRRKANAAEKRATRANRDLVAASTIRNWIPDVTATTLDAAGSPAGEPVTRPLVDCKDVAVPATFSGLDTLAMVSVPLRSPVPLSSWKAGGVIASGSTLYATADHAWLATSRWNSSDPVAAGAFVDKPAGSTTQLHRFDTPLGGAPRYLASGEVKGALLNQFSMDEREGMLRVASTTGTPSSSSSEGRVTVLGLDGARLRRVGLVAGLGKGEEIRGVRFVEDLGYVVTFRQTDPLYAIDLSDPAEPVVRGELKINGYSAYLHPAGAGRILGLGQDGTDEGRPTGVQLALFDVSDPGDPGRLDRQRLRGAWSDAENDHHAFTMAGDLALVPFQSWTAARDGGSRFDAGVMAVRVGSGSLSEPTILRPLADGPVAIDQNGGGGARIQRLTTATPVRAAVHDSLVYTLTPTGVAVHETTGARITFADF